jgi:hypothetical protein
MGSFHLVHITKASNCLLLPSTEWLRSIAKQAPNDRKIEFQHSCTLALLINNIQEKELT